MASLDNEVGGLRRDLRLLTNGPVILYLRPEILEEDVAWLLRHRYTVHRLASDTWEVETDSLAAVADALGFPPNWGRKNFSGFWDCLHTIAWNSESDTALVFARFDRFSQRFERYSQLLLDYLARASWHFLLTGRRLIVLIQSDDATIRFDDVGGHTPWMNLQELSAWMPSTAPGTPWSSS